MAGWYHGTRAAGGATITVRRRAEEAERRLVAPPVSPREDIPGDEVPALTDRQSDVLALISDGRPAKRIASELGLSIHTVHFHQLEKDTGARIVILFEGRDAAGKGGMIKRMTERVSPRVFRVVALPTPSDRQKTQLFMQRYIEQLPAAGEVLQLFQVRDGRRNAVLRLPASVEPLADVPAAGDTRIEVTADRLHLIASAAIRRQSGDVAGTVTLGAPIDLAAIRGRLGSDALQASLVGLGAPVELLSRTDAGEPGVGQVAAATARGHRRPGEERGEVRRLRELGARHHAPSIDWPQTRTTWPFVPRTL